MKFFLLLVLAFSIANTKVSAQEKTDSLAIAQSKSRVLAFYEKAMEGNHHLYNGSEYIAYQPIDEEHPYFLTADWTYCDLKYDGEWFQQVPLLYDIDHGKLISSYYYNGNKMQLVNMRVDEFIFAGHPFINLKNITDTATLKPGYYESPYRGPSTVLVMYSKELEEKLEGLDVYRKFIETKEIFVFAHGQYQKIRNKRDLIRTLGGKKKELKDYIREQQLFLQDREKSIVQTVTYFDQINTK